MVKKMGIGRSNTQAQTKSKKRIADYGEVFTADREVQDMLNLVMNETERIDSRFLEPACGTGNFLVDILKRKLHIVVDRFSANQSEFERNCIIALSSIYGIELQYDNVIECRNRLYGIFENEYLLQFKNGCSEDCKKSAMYILEKNIICGDALSLRTTDISRKPIIFSEWSAVNGSLLKRRDFTLIELLDFAPSNKNEFSLFSDLNEEVFIPSPIREFPLKHFLRISEYD